MPKSKSSPYQAWINKKLYHEGVDPIKLRNTVGAFSNKEKSRVMKEKNLSEKQYDRRHKFLSEVYSILCEKY